MSRLVGLFPGTGAEESALAALIATVVGLFVVAVGFSIYAAVLRVQHERRTRRWLRLTARWEGLLLQALADPDSASELRADVAEREGLYFVNFVLGYARRVRGSERLTLRGLADPYLEPLASRTYDRRSEIRTRAVGTLGALGLPRYAKEIIEALDDPSPLVAMVAARSLSRAEFKEYAPEVVARLARFESWSRRFLAAMLAAIGPDAAPVLRSVLVDDDEPTWVRSVAAEALRMLADLDSGDLAARVVEIEEDRELLAAALRLLTEVGRPEHITPVRVRAVSADFVIRSNALQALGTLTDDEADVFTLIAAMDDSSPWVALHAARGLRAARGVDILTDFAESDDPRALLAAQVLSEEVPTSD